MSVDSKPRIASSLTALDGSSDGLEMDRQLIRVSELEAEVAQLREAVESRQQIGLVTGALAVQANLTPEQGWRVLVRLSQHTNTKVREVARVLEAAYFGHLADEDLPLATQLNQHLPPRLRLQRR